MEIELTDAVAAIKTIVENAREGLVERVSFNFGKSTVEFRRKLVEALQEEGFTAGINLFYAAEILVDL